jgi:hypothetical protein
MAAWYPARRRLQVGISARCSEYNSVKKNSMCTCFSLHRSSLLHHAPISKDRVGCLAS